MIKPNQLLKTAIDAKASDLHITVGVPPVLRIDGVLSSIPNLAPLTPEDTEEFVFSLVEPAHKEILITNREVDLSYSYGNSRFRVNIYTQRGSLAAALRLIPANPPTIEELNIPTVVKNFCDLSQGLVLVVGPTGHGKSSTIAALLNHINQTSSVHIVTIEDPIEYLFTHQKSLISQREMHRDTHSWEVALRATLREDPDVVLVGEMRDYETISAAITVAETGHLVFATLHTNSASQTVDRIVDVFPEHQQQQIRVQLAATLEGVVSQRLLPAIGGGRVPAVEVLLSNSAVKNVIREGKSHELDNIITTSSELGMVSLDRSLAQLVKNGKVELKNAQIFALRPDDLMRLVKD